MLASGGRDLALRVWDLHKPGLCDVIAKSPQGNWRGIASVLCLWMELIFVSFVYLCFNCFCFVGFCFVCFCFVCFCFLFRRFFCAPLLARAQHVISAPSSVARLRWRPSSSVHRAHIAVGAAVMDPTARLWNLESPRIPHRTLSGHTDVVTGMQWHREKGTFIWTCSKDGTLRVVS